MKKGIRENIIKTYQNLIDSNFNPKEVQPVLTEQITSEIAEAAEQGGGGEAKSVVVNIPNGNYKFHANGLISLLPEDVLNYDLEVNRPTEYEILTGGREMFGVCVHCKQNEQEQVPADMVLFNSIHMNPPLVNYSEARTIKELINFLDETVIEFEEDSYRNFELPCIHVRFVERTYDSEMKLLHVIPITAAQFNAIIEKIN